MNSGIYLIVNLINGKFYVGSTQNLELRQRQHFNLLRKNKHPNCHLQRSFNKHGEKAFTFRIFLKCQKEKLIPLEQRVIDGSNPEYNIHRLAGRTAGRKASPETIEKLRKARLGFRHSEETKKLISSISKGRRHTDESKRKLSEQHKGKKLSQEHIEKMAYSKSFPLLQYTKDGELIQEWLGIREVNEKLGYNSRCIWKACRGLRKTYLGFIWKFKTD